MLVALAGLLVALGSTPDAARVELSWRAPAACPDADAIHQRLRELVPVPPPGPLVRAAADVTPRPRGGWRLRLTLRGSRLDDRRTIEARDCRGLADVTALLIALAVAPEEIATRMTADPRGPKPPAAGPTAAAQGSPLPPTAAAQGSPLPAAPAIGNSEPPPSPNAAPVRATAPNLGAAEPPTSPGTPPVRAAAPNLGAAEPPPSPNAAPVRATAPNRGAPQQPTAPGPPPARVNAPNRGAPQQPSSPGTAPVRAAAPNLGAPASSGNPPVGASAPNLGAPQQPTSPGTPPVRAAAPNLDASEPPPSSEAGSVRADEQATAPGTTPALTAGPIHGAPEPPLSPAAVPLREGALAEDPPVLSPFLNRPAALVRGAVRIAGGGEIGGIPAFGPAAGLAFAVFRGPWRVELGGTYAARALAYPEPAGVGARLLHAAGAVRACGVPRWRRLEFPVCGGLELGFVRAVARGVAAPQPAGDLWLAAQLSPGLVWAPSRILAVSFTLDVLVALRRPGFHVAGLGELARAEAVGLRPMLGIEARFP